MTDRAVGLSCQEERIVEVTPLCQRIEMVLGQSPEAILFGSFVGECWQNS